MGDMQIRPEDVPVVTTEVTESEVRDHLETPGGPADLRITDSTLRDGSHAMAHQYTEEQVRGVVSALDRAGVQVIEVSHGDGLGGSSFNYGFSKVDEFDLIKAAVEEATQAKIAILMLPGLGTVRRNSPASRSGASRAVHAWPARTATSDSAGSIESTTARISCTLARASRSSIEHDNSGCSARTTRPNPQRAAPAGEAPSPGRTACAPRVTSHRRAERCP